MEFRERIATDLAGLAEHELLRSPRTLSTPPGPLIEVDGRLCVCLASNDYLGLATHPALAASLARAASWATGAGASRLITGSLKPHADAEAALRDFVGQEASLVFSSGYAANVGALQALAGPGDVIFSDELNHASLIDGCRLSRARVIVYRHRDTEHLATLLQSERSHARGALIVSETVFSMDGDLAPLSTLRALADRAHAGLFLDEAHALGVVGLEGRGLAIAEGIPVDVLVGTLGKAFGLMGAFVAGSNDVIRLVTNRARSYVFSTGISPALAATIPTAVDLVRNAHRPRAQLRAHTHRLRESVHRPRLEGSQGESAIVPVILGTPRRALDTADRLLSEGVFAVAIRPPTVPRDTSRLRLVATAAHDDAQVGSACSALRRVLES